MVTHSQLLEKLKRYEETGVLELSLEEERALTIIREYLRERLARMPDFKDIREWLEEMIKKYGDKEILFLSPVTLTFYPDFEKATKYCYYWMQKLLLPKLKEANIEYIMLHGVDCNRGTFIATLRANPEIKFLELNGHGRADVFTGYAYTPVIVRDDERIVEVLKGKIASFLSCEVGKLLVPWLVQNGLEAARAYTDIFVFAINPNKPMEQDETPRFFFEPYVVFTLNMLVNNATVKEAYTHSQEAWHRSLDIAPEDVKPYIRHDMIHEKIFGNENARVFVEKARLEVTIIDSVDRTYRAFMGIVKYPEDKITIKVPEELATGDARVVFHAEYKGVTGTKTVNVKIIERKKPKLEIEVEGLPKELVKGETYTVTVKLKLSNNSSGLLSKLRAIF